MSPPRLKVLVAMAFHSSIRVAASFGDRPCAARVASPVAMVGMNALQLHQVTRATTARRRPVTVAWRYAGLNRSRIVGGAADLAILFQRSGSLTNQRTRKATNAGRSPKRKTYRQ